MIYEQRIYKCYPGRMPDLLKRFETTTLSIWERHGIRQAGFWTPVVENQIWNSFTFLHGYQCPNEKKNGRRLERIPSGSKNEKPPRKMVLLLRL